MKRLLVFTILILLLVGIAAAQITGINAPKSAGGETTGPKAGKVDTTKHYYVAQQEIKSGKETIPVGGTFSSATDISGQAAYTGKVAEISPDAYKFTQKYKGKYEYVGEGRFSYEKEIKQPADNLFEKYEVTTTVTISQDSDGNIHRTYDEVTKICGKGLTACDGVYTEIPGSHIRVTETYAQEAKTINEKEQKRSALTTRLTVIYGKDKDGNVVQKGTLTTNYQRSSAEDPFSTRMAKDITIHDTDGKTYYFAKVNAETGEVTIEDNIGDFPGTAAEKRALREQAVTAGVGAYGFWEVQKTLDFGQKIGRAMRAYYEYAGLRQLTAIFWPKYDEEVQKRKEEIQQQFCLAAGITNCVTSTICGSIYKIKADNILTGRGPGGRFVSSASLNAERSMPIDVEGLTRQQLIDLFGNTTVIKGVLINLTDPSFNPAVLGRIKLRLYHVQFSVTNNLGTPTSDSKQDLHYNLVFQKVPQEFNSSYGTPVITARWWKSDQTVTPLATARDDVYKFSGTEYNSVCLSFDPRLPSGHAALSEMVDELCVPFAEYAGGPTEIGETAAQQAAAPAPGVTVSDIPGALV